MEEPPQHTCPTTEPRGSSVHSPLLLHVETTVPCDPLDSHKPQTCETDAIDDSLQLPALEDVDDACSLLADHFASLFGTSLSGLLPLPLPPRPVKSSSKSPRLRNRHARRLKAWKTAVAIVSGLNAVNTGVLEGSHFPALGGLSPQAAEAQQVSLRDVLHEAARFAKGRRDFGPTGGRSGTVEQLVKSATVDKAT